MMDCISVENMRLSDAYTIENHVPSLVLMGRAARGVYDAVRKHRPGGWDGKTAIVTGSGNNGGDGFALACILKEAGFDCCVFFLSSKRSGDSAHYAAQAEMLGVEMLPFEEGCLSGFCVVVDCLLGTGFQGALRPAYKAAIDEINRSSAYTVCVDINSGMNGDTGEGERVVFSDLTVTIGFVKQGLVTQAAGKAMKKLVCTDIGIRLVKKEGTITPEKSPVWLDMEIIPAKIC